MSNPMSRAVIVGATSSLAVALMRKLAAMGVDLVLVGRDMGELKRLSSDLEIRGGIETQIHELDLFDENINYAELVESYGEFDAAFLIAGAMGDDNKTTPENIAHVVDVNFTRQACLMAALADRMDAPGREKSGGVIAVVSSVAGDRGRANYFVYGSAKAGLTAFASGLRAKLAQARSVVHVLTIKPGFVDTPMTFAMNSPLMATRKKAADDIIRAVQKRKNILYTPWFWQFIMLAVTHIPEAIFKKLRF